MKNLKKLLLLAALTLSAAMAAAQDPETDWANFGRFEAENAALASSPEVVLMGNSITEGWIRLRPGFFAENGYVSRAISGQTTSQMLVRFRADVVELHPRIVVICAGTNDIARNTGRISLEHILDNLQSMVELARANGIRPILCSVPPAGAFGWRPELKPAQDIVRLNGMIRAYADAEGIPYVDYHTPHGRGRRVDERRLHERRRAPHRSGLCRDGAHPAARRQAGAGRNREITAPAAGIFSPGETNGRAPNESGSGRFPQEPVPGVRSARTTRVSRIRP